jgi:hypothetical protein
MKPATLQSLLRRTAVAIAATAVAFVSIPASALTVTLSSGQTCSYSGMTVDPAGNVVVTCSGTTTGGGTTLPPVTTGPDTFTLTAPVSLTVGSTGNAMITRSGTPSTGNVAVNFAIMGACSGAPNSGQIVFTPTTPSQPLALTGIAAGTCSILMNIGYGTGTAALPELDFAVTGSTPTGGTTGGPTPTGTSGSGSLPYNVNTIINQAAYVPGLNGAAVPTVPTCPSPDPSTRMANLPLPNGVYINPLMAPSGTITSFPLYGLNQFNRTNASVNFGETPFSYSPAPYTADVSISPCPGVIPATYDVRANCDRRGDAAVNGWSLGWVNSASSPVAYFNCLAPETTQYYYNVRWTYSAGTCAQGQTTCGFSVNTN